MPAENASYTVDPVRFAELVGTLVRKYKAEDRFILQSADYRTIDTMYRKNPRISRCLSSCDNDNVPSPRRELRQTWRRAMAPERKIAFEAEAVAALHCVGDLSTVGIAWQYLFRIWLPASDYQPANMPGFEVFARTPEEIGWETFDLYGCLPIVKL